MFLLFPSKYLQKSTESGKHGQCHFFFSRTSFHQSPRLCLHHLHKSWINVVSQMENLPKLLPLWHSVTLRETSEKRILRTPMHMYPDHGGAGIDMHFVDDELQCEELKSSLDIAHFQAKTCALPLLPPNKVSSLFDPCLGTLLQDEEKEKGLFFKFNGIWNAMKQNPNFRDRMMKLLKKAPKYAQKGKYEKIKAPPSVINLAENFPKHFPSPRARWAFTGGCLANLKSCSSTENLLLYPVGRKLNSLALTPLKEDEGSGLNADQTNQAKIAIASGGGRIFQISTVTKPLSFATDVCCVRQKKMYHYIRLKPFEENVDSYPMESYIFDGELSDVKLSNYIPGEHVVATVGGQLLLQDAERKKVIWQSTECLCHDSVVDDMWWGCDFGSHPRSILYTDRLKFNILDLRSKNPDCLKVVSMPNPFFQETEQIMMSRRLDANDFQHIIATDLHMFVFDERYPNQPMIAWNHMLESCPLYCDVKPYRSSSIMTELVAILGSQKSQDIAAFHVNCSSSRIQPFSLSPPCHLSSPRDCIKALELQCIHVHDDVSQRLSLPLIGVCVLPFLRGDGYSVVQLTSLGDVFYQNFFQSETACISEKTFRVEPGCSLPPADEILSSMSSWMEEAIISRNMKESFLSKDVSFMFVDREGIIEEVLNTKRAVRCVTCNPPRGESENNESDNDDEEDVVNCDICPRCGLHVDYGQQLQAAAENFGVLSGPYPGYSSMDEEGVKFSRKLQLVDLDSITDPLSKMVLKEWPQREKIKLPDEGATQADEPGAFDAAESDPLQLRSSQTSVDDSRILDSLMLTPLRSSTLDDSFIAPSQDLFPSQESSSQAWRRNKLKKIKLSSSLGF